MSTTMGKRLVTVLKSALHIVIYILLGLVLAFFINSTAQAAEPDYSENPLVSEETAVEDAEGDGESNNNLFEPPTEPIIEPVPTSTITPEPPQITETATPSPIAEPTPPPAADPTGRLLVHSRAEGFGTVLSGTTFAVHRTVDNTFIAELITDMFGEALLELPAGDYYLRKTAVSAGFILNTDRINFTVRANEIREITVLSKPEPVITPPPVPQPGRLVIVNRTESVNASLSGSVFYIFNAMNDQFLAEVITNQFGEVSFELLTGDYYIRQIAVPAGVLLNTERISFKIAQGEVRTITVINKLEPAPTPPATTTPPPAEPLGRLIVTVRADGTRENLQGAVFTLHHSLTDEIVARLTTDRFGEASLQLPAGDYFLRQTAAPIGFMLNTDRVAVRIQGNSVREINITNRAEPIIENDNSPVAGGSGKLLIFMRADGTRELLEGAVFALHEARYDIQISTLTTDRFGEAVINLPAGAYYLRQTAAPDGFILNSDRINFQISADEVREITVTGKAAPVTAEPAEAQPGRLLVTVRTQVTGETLQGVYFAVHDGMTDEVVTGKHTDQFGEISIQLPAGDYFLRQMTTPDGFVINTDRIPVRIRDGTVTDITVTRMAVLQPTPEPTQAPTPAPTQRPSESSSNAPPVAPAPTAEPAPSNQGRIEIITRAAGSGNLLSGGIYGIYRASDSLLIEQVTTGVDGVAHVMVEPGMYFIRELRPTFGYYLETERIFMEVGVRETVVVELTKVRDFNIIDLPPDADGNAFIYITQTGQDMSMFHYMGGGFMLVIALAAGGLVLWELLSYKKLKRGASNA